MFHVAYIHVYMLLKIGIAYQLDMLHITYASHHILHMFYVLVRYMLHILHRYTFH